MHSFLSRGDGSQMTNSSENGNLELAYHGYGKVKGFFWLGLGLSERACVRFRYGLG